MRHPSQAPAVATVSFTLNGRTVTASSPPFASLAETLRCELGLTGTKLGCAAGDCGACTVRLDGVAVRSCLVLAVQADGAEIQTVEGLVWGPLQEAFRANHALQCGFCTPGILLAASDLLDRGGPPTRDEIVDMLSGHLCRCTGYEPIVDAIAQAAETR